MKISIKLRVLKTVYLAFLTIQMAADQVVDWTMHAKQRVREMGDVEVKRLGGWRLGGDFDIERAMIPKPQPPAGRPATGE